MENRKALLQAGIVLIVIIVFISFVAGSDANGYCAGIVSIAKGILNTILFIVGLIIALILSVAILIGIYLICLLFYSREQADKTYNALKEKIGLFVEYCKKQCLSLYTKKQATEKKTYTYSAQLASTTESDENNTDRQKVSDPEREAFEYKEALEEARAEIEELKEELRTLKEAKEKEVQKEMEYDLDHRLFFYIEKDNDKTAVANAIIEAVERQMTYGEIDAHLSASLPKALDSTIKEHPSLTRDFIRSCKKILEIKQS